MSKTIKSTKIFRKHISIYNQSSEHKEAEFLYAKYDYDNKGNILLIQFFSEDGNPEEETKYSYDSNGHLISEEIYLSGIDVAQRRTLEYAEAEHKVIERTFYEDNTFSKKITSYDEGRITKIEYFEDESKSAGQEIFEYNKNKMVTAHTILDENNSEKSKETCEYNGNNVISENQYKDEKPVKQISYKYDNLGRLILKEDFANGILQETTSSEYDAHGNVIKEITTAGNAVIYMKTSKFDVNNNCIEEEDNYPQQKRGSFIKRQFDGENNLIEEIHAGAIELGEDHIDRFEYEFYY